MPVFNEYANYYDALYAEKDYAAECNYLQAIFSKHSKQPVQTILDMGCGTGGHVFQLAERGYNVHGVDQSEEMLTKAQQKKKKHAHGKRVNFQQGDIRSVRLGKKFDAVVSMFAVMGYMVGNDDLQAAMKTAREHLSPGGIFFFDAWYGPAVLSERPADRYKIIQIPGGRIIRFAHPELDLMRQSVDVHYRLLHIAENIILSEVTETHRMRFFFAQEVAFHLKCAGFRPLLMSPFLEFEEILTEQDWNFSVVAEAE